MPYSKVTSGGIHIFVNYTDKNSTCSECGVTSTPVWRQGKSLGDGKNACLCNACGIRHKRATGQAVGGHHKKKKPSPPTTARPPARQRKKKVAKKAPFSTGGRMVMTAMTTKLRVTPGRMKPAGLPAKKRPPPKSTPSVDDLPIKLRGWVEDEAKPVDLEQWLGHARSIADFHGAGAGGQESKGIMAVLKKIGESKASLSLLEKSGVCHATARLVEDKGVDEAVREQAGEIAAGWRKRIEAALSHLT